MAQYNKACALTGCNRAVGLDAPALVKVYARPPGKSLQRDHRRVGRFIAMKRAWLQQRGDRGGLSNAEVQRIVMDRYLLREAIRDLERPRVEP